MTDTLLQKIQSCQRCIHRVREIYSKSEIGFEDNFDAQDAAILNLIRMWELTIDIANLIVRRDKLGIPTSSAESFELLRQSKRIDRKLTSAMTAMVGFRNIAVHQYRELELSIVLSVIKTGMDDVIVFIDHLLETEGD